MKTAGRFSVCVSMILPVGLAWLSLSCTRTSVQPKAGASRPSDIKVEVRDGGPVVLTTSAAEFQILPSGAVQAFLLKDGKKLTLDEPGVATAADGDSDCSRWAEIGVHARTSDRPKYWKRRASWDAASAWRSRGIRWRRAAWEWKGRWRWKLTTIFRMSRWCRWRTRMSVRAILQSIRQRCSNIASTRDWRTRRRSLMRCGRFKDRATTGERTMCRN